jgi:hypothetical protein
MMSLVQSFGLGRNAAGNTWLYFVIIHYFKMGVKFRSESALFGLVDKSLDCRPQAFGGVVGYHVVRAIKQYVIRLLTGNSGCNGNLLPKGHRLDSLVYSPSLQ